jgi:hypothetical protein
LYRKEVLGLKYLYEEIEEAWEEESESYELFYLNFKDKLWYEINLSTKKEKTNAFGISINSDDSPLFLGMTIVVFQIFPRESLIFQSSWLSIPMFACVFFAAPIGITASLFPKIDTVQFWKNQRLSDWIFLSVILFFTMVIPMINFLRILKARSLSFEENKSRKIDTNAGSGEGANESNV